MNLMKAISTTSVVLITLIFIVITVENSNIFSTGKEKNTIGLFLTTYLNTELKIDHEIKYDMTKPILGGYGIDFYQLGKRIHGEIDSVVKKKTCNCLVGKNFATQCTVNNDEKRTLFKKKKKGIVKIHEADNIEYQFKKDGTFSGKYFRMGKFYDWTFTGLYDRDGIVRLDMNIPFGFDFDIARID